MKILAKNERMLEVAISEMYRLLNEYGELAIDFEKPFRPKSKRQNNFFWGAIVSSVLDYYERKGITYSPDEIKCNFYQAIAPKKTITQFNGKQYETWKSISEMSLEEMSEFIDKAIWLCDNAKAFSGLVLHPSIRYTYIRHLDFEEKRNADSYIPPMRDNEYLSFIRKQACIWCGKNNCSHAHHMRIGGKGGVSIKPSDAYCVPLCPVCHNRIHLKGVDEFLKDAKWITKYVSFEIFLKMNYMKWRFKR